MTDLIRVLVVDDHELMRVGISSILSSAPDIAVAGEASDGAAAVTEAARLRPDVVLMDIQMPGLDGLEATKAIIQNTPDSAVLAMTTFDRDDYLFGALEAGASGFILKNATPEDIIAAVRTLARGDALLAPDVTRRVIETFHERAAPDNERDREASANLAALGLTPREAEVFALVAQGLSNREIAAHLFMGETTVKTHVSRLLTKSGLRDRVQLVVLAYRKHLAQ